MTRPSLRTVSKNCHYLICGQVRDNLTDRQVAFLGSTGLFWLESQVQQIPTNYNEVLISNVKNHITLNATIL